MTYQELLTEAMSRISVRSTGNVGTEDAETTAIRALNTARRNLAEDIDVPEYRRRASVAVLTTAYSYDYPTVDSDGAAITVAEIRSARLLASGDTYDRELEQITPDAADRWPTPTSSVTGRPYHFYQDGRKIYFLVYPDEAYTMNLKVRVYPVSLTAADLSGTVEIGYENCLSYYTTHLLFSWQQATDDASYWHGLYRMARNQAHADRVRKGHVLVDSRRRPGLSADPTYDPLVRSWR